MISTKTRKADARRNLRADLKRLQNEFKYYEYDGVYNHFNKYFTAKVQTFETPRYPDLDIVSIGEQVVRELGKMGYCTLADIESSYLKKLVGPQGGQATFEQVADRLVTYYRAPQDEVILPPLIRKRVTSYLAALIPAHAPLEPLSKRATYATFKGSKKSNSGIFLWTDRRPVSVRLHALNEAFSRRSLDPAVHGNRFYRNKTRDIFMDTFPNLFRGNRLLVPMRELFLKTGIPSWTGMHDDELALHNFWRRYTPERTTTIEFDVDAMDQCMDPQSTHFVLDLLRESGVRMTDTYAQELHEYVDMIYSQPVIGVDGIHYGPWSMISGVPPTNDWETYTNSSAFISFMASHYVGADLLIDIPHVLRVLGDDIIAVFARHFDEVRRYDSSTPVDISIALVEWAKVFHLKANTAKQAVRHGEGFYCRHYFSPRLPQYTDVNGKVHLRAAYPLSLALNNWKQPERLSHPNWDAYQYQVFLGVWGGTQGHPLHRYVVNRLFELGVVPVPQLEDSDAALIQYRAKGEDWYYHLFGVEQVDVREFDARLRSHPLFKIRPKV